MRITNHDFRSSLMKYVVFFCTLIISRSFLLAQATDNPVDLAAANLRSNAALTQNDPPGKPLQDWLADARKTAALKGIPWQGLDITVGDEFGGATSNTALLEEYKKRACQADAIVVGHTTSWVFHQSASETAVYGDYDLIVDAVIKSTPTASLKPGGGIIVTRPGGDFLLSNGAVRFNVEAFPTLQSGVSYLHFLQYVPKSLSYRPLDSLSTLVSTGEEWRITRKTFSRISLPVFLRGTLESSIGQWLASCK